MSLKPPAAGVISGIADPVTSTRANHVVLVVLDHLDAWPELKQVLRQKGYDVIDTDNGQDAAKSARHIRPDLLVVDLDVPLLYGLVAARQIIKHAQIGPLPAVIVTHEDVVDPAPMMEVGATRNEYVTRLADYQELQHLLDYLLPILTPSADANPVSQSPLILAETTRLPLVQASAPELHLHRGAGSGRLDLSVG